MLGGLSSNPGAGNPGSDDPESGNPGADNLKPGNLGSSTPATFNAVDTGRPAFEAVGR